VFFWDDQDRERKLYKKQLQNTPLKKSTMQRDGGQEPSRGKNRGKMDEFLV